MGRKMLIPATTMYFAPTHMVNVKNIIRFMSFIGVLMNGHETNHNGIDIRQNCERQLQGYTHRKPNSCEYPLS